MDKTMTWFESLLGFPETNADQVRAQLRLEGEHVISKVTGQRWICGRLETPSLAQLRDQTQALPALGPLSVHVEMGTARNLHANPDNAGALFQVASQFNLLEMSAPHITPDDGITRYEHDLTQGPACAMAAGAGTLYRQYFVPIGGQQGQTRQRQLDMLSDLGHAWNNAEQGLWKMENGYLIASRKGLEWISSLLEDSGPTERLALSGLVRIGIQWGTQVTLGEATHRVTQAYCSALPVAYSSHSAAQWAPFARFILEAAYEATLHVARLNAAQGGTRRVFLTFLGGGAFGNAKPWILDALHHALMLNRESGLDVRLVCTRPWAEADALAARFST
jgi:hypothetical protein